MVRLQPTYPRDFFDSSAWFDAGYSTDELYGASVIRSGFEGEKRSVRAWITSLIVLNQAGRCVRGRQLRDSDLA